MTQLLKLFRTYAVCSLLMTLHHARAAEIIAHRGASHDAPENTLAAFRLGYAQGADADELDIHLTKDGKVVVIHDGDTKRTGGVNRKIVDQTFDELRSVDVGQFGGWRVHGFSERVPLLSEVLALIPTGKRLFIEIKVHEEIMPGLVEVIKSSGKGAKALPIITFYYEVAKAAKMRLPDHEVCWLHSWTKDAKTGEYPRIENLIEKAKAAGLDGLDLQFGFPIDRAFVEKVHAAGLKLYTWTVDDPKLARREAEAGVDGITTNEPARIREAVEAK